MTKKKCCNKLCVNCRNYRLEHVGNPGKTTLNKCNIAIDQVIDYVTGGMSNVYLIPEEANCNGDCKHYREDEQKMLWAELRALAQKYHNVVFMGYHGDYTCFSEYRAVQDLLIALNRERTWHDEYGDKDEESETVEKKKKHWWSE